MQEKIVYKIRNENELDHILVLEHSSTYTAGRRSKGFKKENEDRLCALTGAQVFDTNRGGMVTWHGSGQLVIYPILNLKRMLHKPNFHDYVEQLQGLMIDICNEMELTNVIGDDKKIGIWKDNKKLGFIGFRNEGWITSHGCSLNINCDLNNFNYIIPCGDKEMMITSMQKELGMMININNAINVLRRSVEHRFNSETIDMEKENDKLSIKDY